jgi:tRNA/tmRNA/rRNA uracil-C5-methylase (TrmA/RlmC/RlmD family)
VIGSRVELTVGAVAHGGHCVARLSTSDGPGVSTSDDGPGLVVFVRHALPGERVVAVVTEQRRGYLRADAVEVLDASPDRAEPPCPYAGPGRCGGCDFQHATPAAQRELKATVVREQLVRLAGLTADEVEALRVRVEPLPGDTTGWRSRVQYTVDSRGRLGFHQYRSHRVVPVDRCLIAHPLVARPSSSAAGPGVGSVEAVASSGGDVTILTRPRRGSRGMRVVSGPELVRERAVGREWTVAADGFWQVHPAAPDTLAACVLDLLGPKPGEHAFDLYGGAGLFAAALAPFVGRVTVVESDPRGVAAARRNLADLPQVRVVSADAARFVESTVDRADLVVLDPPRAGVGASVVHSIAAWRPRAVAYVSCDPAAFARDVATFRSCGWRLARLRAFDAFPMTHHVETVGLLES